MAPMIFSKTQSLCALLCVCVCSSLSSDDSFLPIRNGMAFFKKSNKVGQYKKNQKYNQEILTFFFSCP